ncbi:transmembrane protein, putative [Medicago truncatula]|uniref:Transmembrane protein, putative n=1 Tax=Medicago truncatula TaxID=3880 RepID=G7JC65_MEDTR|nr:transmembrane protein, putative [Medicago truncatula]
MNADQIRSICLNVITKVIKLYFGDPKIVIIGVAKFQLFMLHVEVLVWFWKNEQTNDFVIRGKWINASHFHKLLVEPVDIAEYYGKGMQKIKGRYIQHGRERRYEIFDMWWKDSISMAKVEEAKEWLSSVTSESDTSMLVNYRTQL